jgi:carbon monoxide dehydrogenase subunit G
VKVELEKVFPLMVSSGAAWALLHDIPQVAACMPGAEITEQVDDSHYKGKVKVKLGPALVAFTGEVEVRRMDFDARELQLIAKGQDVKGTSTATMDLTASIREISPGTCELLGRSEVSVTGKLASFGGRMMTQVSDLLLKQFAENFAANVATAEDPAVAQIIEPPPRELNGLAFAWAVLVGFFKSLFAGKSSGSG